MTINATKNQKNSTVSQVASRFEVDHSTVLGWIKRNFFPHAALQQDSLGSSYWLIPERDLINFQKPRRGPKRKEINIS